jgi:hypothetical protein
MKRCLRVIGVGALLLAWYLFFAMLGLTVHWLIDTAT